MYHETTREVITTGDALTELVVEAGQRDAIALDTEFLWERTYYPRLGLIQLALSNEECSLIDPLAIDDLHPLGELLANRNIVKIFHDAPQDLAILARATGTVPQNIFDTRLAAGFAGLPATLSLANLIKQLLDIEIDKSATRTNWLRRPLSEKQQLYAADDVRYLRAIRVLLLARIATPETEKWLREELSLLDDPQCYDFFNPELCYKKIRGFQQLKEDEPAILQQLCLWREERARQKDRPRGHIVRDALLLELAREKPVTITALQQTNLSAKAVNNYGSEIIEHIKKAQQYKEIQVPACNRPHKLTKTEKKIVFALSKYIQLKSDTFGIDPALVANAAELKEIVHSMETGISLQNGRHASGWRRDFLADFVA